MTATYRGYEPQQFGVPVVRYKRRLVRMNGLVQDDNCLPDVPAFGGKLGWQNSTTSQYGVLNAGTEQVVGSPVTLAFKVLDALDLTGVSVVFSTTPVISGTLPVFSYSALTGLGTVTWALDSFGSVAGGVTTLTLLKSGVAAGMLTAVATDNNSPGGGIYDNVQWRAYASV